MPNTLIVNKIGNHKSIILGNIFVAASILLMIFANGLPTLIISQLLSAIGFGLKNLSESTMLFDSLEKNDKRNHLFAKIDGKSSSFFYYLDSITSLATGFLFIVNGYLPMVLCFAMCIISTLISMKFSDIISPKSEIISIKDNFTDIKEGFSFIFQSKRLRDLIIFYSIFTGLLGVLSTLRSSILTDVHLPSQYFGIVYAVLQIISGIASRNQHWFHKKYKNRTLTFFALSTTLTMIVIGMCEIIGINFDISLEIILMMLAVQFITKGAYHTLIKRYLNSFSSSSMRTKIYSAIEIPYSIVRTLLCLICSSLLTFTTTSYVYIILGCSFTAIFIFLLDHMKNTVGLKPEEYEDKDIKFKVLH